MTTGIIIIFIIIIICMHVKPSVMLEIHHVAVHSCGTWGMYFVPETIYEYTENTHIQLYYYTILLYFRYVHIAISYCAILQLLDCIINR